MKKTLILLSIILVFTLQIKAQNNQANFIFTDSTLVLGRISEDYASICDDVSSYCTCISKTLDKGTFVIVSGTKTCNKSYSDPDYFYEISYKNKTYYINKDNLEFSNDIDYFSEISKLSEDQAITFKNKATFTATAAHNRTLNDVFTFLKTCKTKGLAILHWNIYDESEHTEGTSFKIEFYNPTKKTIKYITTTIVGYNPVGDRVYNSRKQSYTCQVKSVGPIEPEASGSYSFDYVWFTDMVETAKITSLVVQYMDGTTKTITSPESIRLKKNLYSYLQDE